MLKRTIFSAICILMFANSYGQDNIVKASALLANVGLQYERALNDHFSVIGQVGVSRLSNSTNDINTTSEGFGYYLEGRYYFSAKNKKMEGWHVGAFYNVMNTETDDNLKTNISSIGLATGYQWIYNSNITFGLTLGAGSKELDTEQDRGLFIDGLTFWPHLGLNLGYSF